MMKFKLPGAAFNKVVETLTTYAMQSVKEACNSVLTSIKDKLVFTMTIRDDSEVYHAFQDWFYENHNDKFKSVTVYNVAKNSDGQKVKASTLSRYHQPESSGYSFDIGYSQNSGTYTIKHNGTYIQVTKGRIEGDKSMGERQVQYYTLSSVNKAKTKALVEDIYEQYNSQHDQIKIFVSDLYGNWNLVKRITGKTLDNIVINKDLHNTLVTDLVDFEKDQEWYEGLNIPYKRGYLFYGPPGNGKTSLAIAIASEHKRNIYCLDINKLRDDAALRLAFMHLQSNALLMIEDIDVAFKMGRETSGKGKPPVTFACLLNCLDGVYYKEGLLTIMTTNFIERLDAALIRPGRMDLKIHIPNPGKEEVETYISRFYGKEVVLEGYDKVIPMAAVQGVCITHKHDCEKAVSEIMSFDDTVIVATYTSPLISDLDEIVEDDKNDEETDLEDDAYLAGSGEEEY